MKPRPIRSNACLLALCAPLASAVPFPRDIYVGVGDVHCDYATIQEAVDAASTETRDTVWLSTTESYDAQHVVITGKSVRIAGTTTCNGNGREADGGAPPPQVTVSGADWPVFSIDGAANVELDNLFVTGGQASGDFGGGVRFQGNGSLTLANVTLTQNTAGSGGGVGVSAEDGTVNVYLNADTLIVNNTADASGGGLFVVGQVSLYVLSPQTLIAFNTASTGYGGGIAGVGLASVTVASAGYGGGAVIQFNSAAYGGGIAMIGDDDGRHTPWLRMFTKDASNPVQVSSNTATVAGGGIYLKPPESVLSAGEAFMCAQDFRIDDNIAPEGAALHLDWSTTDITFDTGSTAFLNEPSLNCDPESLGAVPCAAGVPCNEIAGNAAEDAGGQPTDGATILVGSSSTLGAHRLSLRHNTAHHLVRAIGDNDDQFGLTPSVTLDNCLIASNDIARELIRIGGDDVPVTIKQCSLVDDIINSTHAIKFDNTGGTSLTLTDSIIDEPGTLALDYPGSVDGNPAIAVQYVLSNDITTLPADPTVMQGEPQFVDAANGDFHLLPASLGVDFAPIAGGVDLDGRPRDVDMPVPDVFGPRDLGAYERQSTFDCGGGSDTIYCNGFEPF